jgi:hypothetical protein
MPWVALAMLALGCDDGVEDTRTPTLQIEPAAGFIFSKLAPGETAERTVDVLNLGSGVLILRDVQLEDESSNGEFELFQLDGAERRAPARVIEIPPEGRITFAVEYAASDDSPFADRGAVTFESNDPSAIANSVAIVTSGAGGEIDVRPPTIDFGRTEAGQEDVEILTVRNNGVSDLEVNGFSVNGSADFSARYEGRDLLGELDPPIVIGSGEQIEVEVVYAPPTLGPDQGELIITSNDDGQPTVTVRLIANGAAACIRVTPDNIEFGAALLVENRAVETPNRQGLSIASCGSSPLRVDRIEFEGNDAFGIFQGPMAEEGQPLIELPAADGEVLPTEEVIVGFWPEELIAYGGTMLVHSNAPDSPTRVQLFGRGVDNTCPIPDVVEDTYAVQPLEILTLDGTPSIDPGGEVREWRYEVIEAPAGSVSQPLERFGDLQRPADGGDEDDASTPTAQFFVDLAGRYEIHLRVVDNLGQVSCDPTAFKRIIIEARPEKDLHIELTWSTPEDPDQTDMHGTDVDLHVKHENGGEVWGEGADPWDCYFANISPEWGRAGDVVDNPTLDIDDTNGAGPENVNLSQPEPGVTYEVGALYFRATSAFNIRGADSTIEHLSYATIRIYVRGDLLAEYVDTELSSQGQLWWAASVRWCDDLATCPEITPRGEILTEEQWALP